MKPQHEIITDVFKELGSYFRPEKKSVLSFETLERLTAKLERFEKEQGANETDIEVGSLLFNIKFDCDIQVSHHTGGSDENGNFEDCHDVESTITDVEATVLGDSGVLSLTESDTLRLHRAIYRGLR